MLQWAEDMEKEDASDGWPLYPEIKAYRRKETRWPR